MKATIFIWAPHRRYRETYNTRWIERNRIWPADLAEGDKPDRDETRQR